MIIGRGGNNIKPLKMVLEEPEEPIYITSQKSKEALYKIIDNVSGKNMTKKKGFSCCDCIHSHITIHNYLQCKLTGNCYIPIVMKEEGRIGEDCPLYKNIKEGLRKDDERRI